MRRHVCLNQRSSAFICGFVLPGLFSLLTSARIKRFESGAHRLCLIPGALPLAGFPAHHSGRYPGADMGAWGCAVLVIPQKLLRDHARAPRKIYYTVNKYVGAFHRKVGYELWFINEHEKNN